MEGIIGEIKLVTHNFQMKDYIYCDGRPLSIEQYTPLYALIGIKFGGNGTDTFCLPKLENPSQGMCYVICVNGIFPARD